MSEVSSAPYSGTISKMNMNDFVLFPPKSHNFVLKISYLLTGRLFCCLKDIYYFCITRVRAQNAILEIPNNKVVRIEDTAIKWRFIMNVGCINEIKGKIGFLDV